MKKNEKLIASLVLLFTSGFIVYDLFSDSNQGSSWWHLLIEAMMALFALVGFVRLIKDVFFLKQELAAQKIESEKAHQDALNWKKKSESFILGLSQSIDEQLVAWHLTQSEKEIALLLLKGFSVKEICDLRKTSEKTVRAQCTSIYSKSGLSGKTELSAFFLEDLLSGENKK